MEDPASPAAASGEGGVLYMEQNVVEPAMMFYVRTYKPVTSLKQQSLG